MQTFCTPEPRPYGQRSQCAHLSEHIPGRGSSKAFYIFIAVYQAGREKNPATLLEEFQAGVNKKTFKKGKASKIRISYPEGLMQATSKRLPTKVIRKKAATVNSKGEIKGIRKGQTTITVKVTLGSGDSKTFKSKNKSRNEKVPVKK